MQETLKFWDTTWTYIQEPDPETIQVLAKEYGFHEVIVDDLLEINAQSKIDSNSKHLFLALTFTKYLESEQRYLLNELDVIIGEDFIVTTTPYESESFKKLLETIKHEDPSCPESYKCSPYYLLYRIIDSFYDKTMKSLTVSSRKLFEIQEKMSNKHVEENIVEDLMDENLNKIFIKHNFLSQQDVLAELIEHVNLYHEKHLNVYYNSLKVKLVKIVSTINVLSEKNDSLMSAYNTFIGIKNNNNVTRLTFVNAIFMPLTLIAGIGGMSERSMMTGPDNWKIAYPLFFLLCAGIAYITIVLLRKFFLKK